MIVAGKCFLLIEEGTDDPSGSIIYGDMQSCFFGSKPFIRRSIHLRQFSKISASRPSGVSVFDSNQICLDPVGLLLRLCGLLFLLELLYDSPALGFCYSRGEDSGSLKDRSHR